MENNSQSSYAAQSSSVTRFLATNTNTGLTFMLPVPIRLQARDTAKPSLWAGDTDLCTHRKHKSFDRTIDAQSDHIAQCTKTLQATIFKIRALQYAQTIAAFALARIKYALQIREHDRRRHFKRMKSLAMALQLQKSRVQTDTFVPRQRK